MEQKLRHALEEAIAGLKWDKENEADGNPPAPFDKSDQEKIDEWSELLKSSISHFSILEAEDSVVHFVASGFTDDAGGKLYFRFWEDPYQLEPWQAGIELISVEHILRVWGDDLRTTQQDLYHSLSNNTKPQ